MKKPPYKTEKWEKCKKKIIPTGYEYDKTELADLEQAFSDEKIDKVRFHYSRALIYANLAQDEFAIGNTHEVKACLTKSVDSFIASIRCQQEGINSNEATKIGIERKINSGYFGYFAIILGRYDDIPMIAAPDSAPYKLIFRQEDVDLDESEDPVENMIRALCSKDSERFEAAFVMRLKEIRRFHYLCADFISIALIREARKAGLEFQSNYIEVDLSLFTLDNNIILPDETILLIEFLDAKDYFSMAFMGENYKITAKNDVENFVGVGTNGQVFYLEKAFGGQPDTLRYIAKDIQTFIKELNLYKQYCENYCLEENPSDEALEKYANGFKELIMALDSDACMDENTFWSIIIEQMEFEQI